MLPQTDAFFYDLYQCQGTAVTSAGIAEKRQGGYMSEQNSARDSQRSMHALTSDIGNLAP